jgi:hypothetical protein
MSRPATIDISSTTTALAQPIQDGCPYWTVTSWMCTKDAAPAMTPMNSRIRGAPRIWDRLALNTAITLPIGMETYAAYALRAWLSHGGESGRARRFAKWSAITALALGAAGQVAYHLMTAAGVTAAPWPITTLVACLPVAVLGMGAALAHLLHQPEPAHKPESRQVVTR